MPRYQLSSILSKPLSPSIPVHAREPIGRPMGSILPAGARLEERMTANGRVWETYSHDAFDQILRHYPAEAVEPGQLSNEVIRLSRNGGREAYLTRIEAGKTPSGRVEYYSQQSPRGQLTLSDEDGDGKVDWVSEPVAGLLGFQLEGYDPSWSVPSKLHNRVLEDTDHDGRFDVERVTGDWWNRVEDGQP